MDGILVQTSLQNKEGSVLNKELHVSVYGSQGRKGKRWELSGTEKEFKKSGALKIAVLNPPEERFPRYNPFPKATLGDHDTDIVKVDWDERFIGEVKLYSRLINERYHLGGLIILQSSVKHHKVRDETLEKFAYKYTTKSYHTVFNRPVSHLELNSILAWLCLFTKDNKLITWYLLQNIKSTYTLRLGFKGKKKPPKIVYRYGNQDKQIAKYLSNRAFVLNFLKEESERSQ
jgi:hypothetical protein